MSRSERPSGPRHRADGPPDAGYPAFLANQDVLPTRRWTMRRRGDRRQAGGAPVPGPAGERRSPGGGRRRAEDPVETYRSAGDLDTRVGFDAGPSAPEVITARRRTAAP